MNHPQVTIHQAVIHIGAGASISGLPPLNIQDASDVVAAFLNPDPNRFEYDEKTGTVFDPLTGLMWGDETEELEHDDAMKACSASRQGGYSDWEPSTLRQLQTIVDYTRYNPVLPPPFKTKGDICWASDETPWSKQEGRTGSSRSFFYVYVCYGSVLNYHAYLRFRARPVRRAAPASQ